MKLSFKNQPRLTGLAAVGNYHPFVDIKGDKKVVGWIQPANHQRKFFHIYFHVKDGDGFRNAGLKGDFETAQEAKDFLKERWSGILEKYTLHQLEDD